MTQPVTNKCQRKQKNTMNLTYTKLILAAIFSLASLSTFEQTEAELEEETTSEIAAQLANPNTTYWYWCD